MKVLKKEGKEHIIPDTLDDVFIDMVRSGRGIPRPPAVYHLKEFNEREKERFFAMADKPNRKRKKTSPNLLKY